MDLGEVILDAIIISIILYGGIFLMIAINPRWQLHNYPPEIKKVVPPKTKKESSMFKISAIITLIILVAYIIISFYYRYNGSDLSYFTTLIRWTIVMGIVSMVDLFICDYLIFCTITPKFIIIPGTEGNSGYKNKSYHTHTILTMIKLTIVSGFVCSLTYFII